MNNIIMDKYSFKYESGNWWKYRRDEQIGKANNVELELIEYIIDLERRIAW